MRYLLLLPLLLTSCSPKTYTKPELGIPFNEFAKLCNVQGEIATSTETTNSQNSTLTVKLTDTPDTYPANQPKRDLSCVGTFTFINRKLNTISN